jgi:eukaryotic-like serine/threonine-protein kinase
MNKIKLPKGEWFYDPNKPLGPEGGFGIVFNGQSSAGESLAVKRLKIEANEAAHRELRIAQELSRQDFKNIIPCFDAGQDAESDQYFVVMAKAERSLQDEIYAGKKFSSEETTNILSQIVDGLLEVPSIVHRDLKPGNVLFHEGKWKIADFGIARFVEESTSLKTLKGCLSPPFAAPEQWNYETSSQATDAYALGCIGYYLLAGKPPFNGPQKEDYQRQHLSMDAPKLDNCAPFLRSLISMLLRKSPELRPSLKRVRQLIVDGLKVANESAQEFHALASINARLEEKHSKEEAEREANRLKKQKRDAIAKEAIRNLRTIYEQLIANIKRAAPKASQSGNTIVLGDGAMELQIRSTDSISWDTFPKSGWDVVAVAQIAARVISRKGGIGSSLFYAKRRGEGEYRWWEVGFNFGMFMGKSYLNHIPMDNFQHIDIALSNIMGEYAVAYGPTAIDDEMADAFCSRWANLFAQASEGRLQ